MSDEHEHQRGMAPARGDVNPRLGLGPNSARWRQWLAYTVVFAVILVLLMTVLTVVSGIVEGFFVSLYAG